MGMERGSIEFAGTRMTRFLTRSYLSIALSYLAGYVLLDWISYVHPLSVSGITPWNPQTGLSFALILLFGIEFIPWLFVAPLAASVIVRGAPLPVEAESLVALVIGLGYGAATALLLRGKFDPTLSSKRSLLTLLGAAFVSVAIVSVAHAAVLAAFDILPPAEFLQAAIYSFIGDMIGVMVVTPFVLFAFTRRQLPLGSWELALLHLVVLACVAVVFGFVGANRLQLFYILFIPVIWTAVRFGLEGVTIALVVTQIGLIVAIQLSNQSTIDVTVFQTLMVVLAGTGLALGVVVTEQQQANHRIRLQQEALSRVARVSTMGEFAAAVAHEINQPLTAVANFTRLTKRAIAQQPPDAPGALAAADNAIEQVDRAASVIKRLRDFIRLGRSEPSRISVAQLVQEALSGCRPELDRLGVALHANIDRALPDVTVDALQIEQVIGNLVRNAGEALSQSGRRDGVVTIDAENDQSGRIWIRVRDNGPGFDPSVEQQPITPFTTTKPDGLGLGLSLSRSIVEAHGGKLQIDSGIRGATVAFSVSAA
jgi:two-component system sensor kinase FixL